MKTNKDKKILTMLWSGFKKVLKFLLIILGHMLEGSLKNEEYEPTLDELMRGKQMGISDRYFIPNEKPHKK